MKNYNKFWVWEDRVATTFFLAKMQFTQRIMTNEKQ